MSSSNSVEAQSDCDALHVALNEINVLKNALADKDTQLAAMEAACLRESDRQVELEDSVIAWQDKYDRLYESHKRVQRVNQNLEDKLLKLVDRNASERAQLTSDVATMSVRLAQANFNIAKLQREIERYKADINLAIQLLQCKPDNFMQQKVSSLPIDIQSKVSSYVRLESNSHSDSETSTNGVGMATSASYKVLPASDSPPPAPCPFPPTAMVYSMRGLDAAKNNANSNCNDNGTGTGNGNGNATNSNGSNKSHPSENNQSANNNNNNKNNNNNNNTNSSNSISNSTSSLLLNNNANANANAATGALETTSMISPIVIAKFLEDELKADKIKHCDTCNCATQDLTVLATDITRLYTVATQTHFHTFDGGLGGMSSSNTTEPQSQLCLRCHSNLNSPSRANSPYLMKLVKSSDSVISETKSSVSDLNDIDKLFTPSKKDDLMVNPILGHHRLCDRTAGAAATSGNMSAAVAAANTTPTTTTASGNGKVLPLPLATSTMIYPTTHLGAYAAEKYLLETNSMTVQNCSNPLRVAIPNVSGGGGGGIGSYKRRFLDGGGTALDLLDKYEKQQTKPSDNCDSNELDDEAKPLLSTNSHTSQHGGSGNKEHMARNAAADCAVEMAEVACEELNASLEPINALNSDARDDNGKGVTKSSLKKSTINSSMSSLWSKTSSGDGVKIFENFNRNLIKTIKAENPKYRGPRLCAMRIQQNGQSNILLDNIESIEAVTPVIYKRRERLLDEELDDTKDIITSNSTVIAQNVTHITPTITTDTGTGMMSPVTTTVDINSDANEPASLMLDGHLGLDKQQLPGHEDIVCNDNRSLEEQTSLCHIIPSNEQHANALKHIEYGGDVIATNPIPPVKSSPMPQNFDTLNNMMSSKASMQSKSCTQSSSISDTIDFQENVLLRRQQLSRVAEWVQNNRQQLEDQQQQKLIDAGLSHHCGGARGGDGAEAVAVASTDRQSSTFSTLEHELDSVSIEKLSTDSGYKTTPQMNAGGGGGGNVACSHEINGNSKTSCSPKDDSHMSNINNSNSNSNNNNNHSINSSHSMQTTNQQLLKTYYRRTTRSGLPVPCTYNNGATNTANTQYHTNITSNINTITDLNNGYNNNINNNNINNNNNITSNICHVDSNSSSTTTTTTTNGDCGHGSGGGGGGGGGGSGSGGDTPILIPEQPTCDILNYKYYPSENDKTHAIHAELHTTTQNVDIAQMEYNVKQFLLKQNEWSMRCSSGNVGGGGGGGGTSSGATRNADAANGNTYNGNGGNSFRVTAGNTKLYSGHQYNSSGGGGGGGSGSGSGGGGGGGNVYRMHTNANGNKIMRQVKIFSNGAGGGFGPGVGARVHTTATATTTTTATQRGTATTNALDMHHAMPQRTETNL